MLAQDSIEAWHFGGRDAQLEDARLRQRHQAANHQRDDSLLAEPEPSESSASSRRSWRPRAPGANSASLSESSVESPRSGRGATSSQAHPPASAAASPRGTARQSWNDLIRGEQDSTPQLESDAFGTPNHSAHAASSAAAMDPDGEFGADVTGPTPSSLVEPGATPLTAATTPPEEGYAPWWSPGERKGSSSPRAVAPGTVAAYLHIPSSPLQEEKEEAGPPEKLLTPAGPARRQARRIRLPCRPIVLLARCPALIATFWFLLIGALVGLGMVAFPMNLETSFDDFMKADVDSSLSLDVFIAATQEVESKSRRLQTSGLTMYKLYDLSAAYELKDTSLHQGLLQPRILRTIGAFEQKLQRLTEWQDLCGSTEARHKLMCDPGMSFINYALPSVNATQGSVVPRSISPDGQGRDVLPMDAVRQLLRERGLEDVFLPKLYTALSEQNGPKYLRSSWRFKVPCCSTTDSASVRRAALRRIDDKWHHLTADVLLDTFQEAFQEEDDPVRVWWEGTGFDTIEVLQVLWQDVRLAAGSVLFVLLYLAIHTRSLLLTCAAFLVVPLSLPLAFVVYALLSGASTIGIINFLSVFIIVGLGADVVFVYTDSWRDSALHNDSDAGRLKWTLYHAGKATFATSSTTALSFLANLASVLRPLREFGLFMGLCVTFVWVLISLIYVPFCLTDERLAARGGIETPGQTKTERQFAKIFGRWAKQLSVVRLPFCCLPLLAAMVFCGLALAFAEPEQGMPELFPASHNRNHGLKVFGEFKPASHVVPVRFSAPPSLEPVCRESDFGASQMCALAWCEVTSSVVGNTSSSCTCYRKPRACGAPEGPIVRMRLAGVSSVSQANLDGALPAYVSAGGATAVPDVAGPAPSLLLQNWEAGSFVFVPVTEVTMPVSPPSCGWDDQCYCGTSVCQEAAATWQRQSATLELQGPPVPSRRLASQGRVPKSRRASISVAYGLSVKMDPPFIAERDMANSWTFLGGVDFRQPWAQRDIYRMCTELPGELRVTSTDCWIVDFRKYLLARTPPERFPVMPGKFDRLITEFANVGRTGHGMSKHFLWIRGGSLKACWVSFEVDVDRYTSLQEATEFKERWDKHLKRANLLASEYTQGAFHVSALWASSEAQMALVSSTALSLSLVFVLAFLTMLAFTGNCCLSFHVIVATFEVVSGLFFFMVFVVQWTIGPIEVLALIVFIGYALDYSLHVAQKYGSREALEVHPEVEGEDGAEDARRNAKLELRLRRATHSLKAVGGANLGSAITTAGCSVFLIFCQLTIFKKLGTVVVVVTVLSILTALAFLPAMLLVVGPLQPRGGCFISFRMLRRGCARAVYLAKHPAEIPAAFLSLLRPRRREEADASAKDDALDEPKSFGSKSSWRRQRLGLEAVFEGEEIKELSMGLQAARISMDPILEVVRPAHDQHGARSVVVMDPRPSPHATGGA